MTYEYACAACGHQWEAEQSISEAPLKTCPKCNEPQAKRLVSGGTGFLLKGGGWYADGYGSSGSSKKGGSDTSSSSSGSSSGSGTSGASGGSAGSDSSSSSKSDSKGAGSSAAA